MLKKSPTILRFLPLRQLSSSSLADATISSLFTVLEQRGGRPQQDVAIALRELVAMMTAMADGTALPCFYLFSLDPGVGKTTALIPLAQSNSRSMASRVVLRRSSVQLVA